MSTASLVSTTQPSQKFLGRDADGPLALKFVEPSIEQLTLPIPNGDVFLRRRQAIPESLQQVELLVPGQAVNIDHNCLLPYTRPDQSDIAIRERSTMIR